MRLPERLYAKLTPVNESALDTGYSELVSQAMQRITDVCPLGALKWARAARSDLTDRIDRELMARLNDLWNVYAPLSDFETALGDLVRVHAQVGKLFVNRKSSDF